MSSGAVCCGEQFWKSFFIRDVLNVFSKWSGGPVDSRSRLHRVYLRLMATPKQVLSPRGGGGRGSPNPSPERTAQNNCNKHFGSSCFG